MDDSVKSDSRLEVSVSFGRFENDALSWEKWSSFSPNKYLEEVGTLSTPGSVAQKKAYFEAHYKKIAAKKAEEMEQEKSVGPLIPNSYATSNEDCSANSSEVDNKFGSANGEKLVEEEAISNEAKDDIDRSSEGVEQRICTNGLTDVIASNEEKEDVNSGVKRETLTIEEDKDELNGNVDVEKDSALVELENPIKGTQHIVEKPPERKNGREQTSVLKKGREQTTVLKKENSRSSARNIAPKVTPVKKERNLTVMNKKIVSPPTKPSQASTPRHSKPTLTSTPMSASQSLKKKVNGSPMSKSNNFSGGESKRATPLSLHMSLSMGPTNSLGALSMTRKSLIMERMGDKDIVKRAFKTFQNRSINGSMGDEKPNTVKNVASTGLESKVSTFRTPTKGNMGLRKDTEKTATPRSHSGTKSNPLPSGSHKSSSVGRKNTTTFSPSTGLRSDEKSEKRKEFLKKLEAKSIAREAANAQLSSKSRAGPTLSR